MIREKTMVTPFKSILLFLIASIIGAIGQFLYKEGAQNASGKSLMSFIANWRILIGVICYIGVMVLFVAAFRIGGELTVLYPMYASTFIWALLIGVFYLKEPLSIYKLCGTALIMGGMFLIAKQ
jgi:drug/metabolite transporter (DMT)-like permease